MKPFLGLINTSLAVILGIGCVACVEQPARATSATEVLALRREMLSPERPAGVAAGRVLDPMAFGAALASSAEQDIPGCAHVIEFVLAGSGQFRASASLSCETVNEYSYLDVAAYVTDAARSQVTLITTAAVEAFNAAGLQTFEITGTIGRRQVLLLDSLAITVNLGESVIGYRQTEPSP